MHLMYEQPDSQINNANSFASVEKRIIIQGTQSGSTTTIHQDYI